MEHYMEHSLPVPWLENRFGDSNSRLPDILGSASAPANVTTSGPPCTYLQSADQHGHALCNMRIPFPPQDNTLLTSSLPPQFIQEAYGGTMRGGPAWIPPSLQEPSFPKDVPNLLHPYHPVAGSESCLSHDLPPFSRNNGRDRSNSTQGIIPQTKQTWCQSFINGPRSRSNLEVTTTNTGGSGERSHEQADGKIASHQNPFQGGGGDVAHLGSSQVIQTDAQQVQQQMQGGQPVFAPIFGAQTGAAQPQGAAAVAAGTARPRVRARRGQATDPHSIAERLRRERIAERMKALQELVPNANKTDKASMLDEIIDYVKFLQLQVKVLSMSRLGGAGAVAPLISDFPAQGQSSLAAALGSSAFQDGMAVAERQVARLMEEDMGSAMQFLQAKGLCLMPVSLATVISSNGSRMGMGSGGGHQGFSAAVDQSRMHAAGSSTSSTLASVASSGYIGGEGDSKSKQ